MAAFCLCGLLAALAGNFQSRLVATHWLNKTVTITFGNHKVVLKISKGKYTYLFTLSQLLIYTKLTLG